MDEIVKLLWKRDEQALNIMETHIWWFLPSNYKLTVRFVSLGQSSGFPTDPFVCFSFHMLYAI